MSVEVTLPELGESVVEGTIAKWLVKEGDRVERDQPLVEVTTDKVDAEIPAPEGGVVEVILAAEGETVDVGTPIARIDPAGNAAAGEQESTVEPAPPERGSTMEPAPPERGSTVEPAPPERETEAQEPVRSTPVARRMAEEAGIDLRDLRGSGVSGRIMKGDLAAPRPASAPRGRPQLEEPARSPQGEAPPPSARQPATQVFDEARARFGHYALQEGDRVIPMSPLRRIVAEHMVYSKHTSPHVGTVAEVDLNRVVQLRARHKKRFQEANGFALTYLPFIVAATVRALREFPALNASVIEDAIVEKRDIHLGIAVQADKGLVVPVVRNADRLSLSGLAAAIDDLSLRARNKRLSADELKGGSFTVSNPGRSGNLYGFAIINQPQVGILRMGEIVKRPVVREIDGNDAIVVRPIMHLALSYDHRAVDGAPANGFLHRVRELLEEGDFDV